MANKQPNGYSMADMAKRGREKYGSSSGTIDIVGRTNSILNHNKQMNAFGKEYNDLFANAYNNNFNIDGRTYDSAVSELGSGIQDLQYRMSQYAAGLDQSNPYYQGFTDSVSKLSATYGNFGDDFKNYWDTGSAKYAEYEKEIAKQQRAGQYIGAVGVAEDGTRSYQNDYDKRVAETDDSKLSHGDRLWKKYLLAEDAESAKTALNEYITYASDKDNSEEGKALSERRLLAEKEYEAADRAYSEAMQGDDEEAQYLAGKRRTEAEQAYNDVLTDVGSYDTKLSQAKDTLWNVEMSTRLADMTDEDYDLITQIAKDSSQWHDENETKDQKAQKNFSREYSSTTRNLLAQGFNQEAVATLKSHGYTDEDIKDLVSARETQLNEDYTQKYSYQMYQYGKDNAGFFGKGTARSFLYQMAAGSGYMDQVVQKAEKAITGSNAPIDFNTAANKYYNASTMLREGASYNMSDTAKFYYQGFTSTVDSGIGVAMSYALGAMGIPAAGSIYMGIMSSSAATAATMQAHTMGASDAMALSIGALAGFAEWVTEKYSLEAVLKNINVSGPGWTSRFANFLLHNAATEASEEAASDLINWFGDVLLMQDLGEWENSIRECGGDETEAFLKKLLDIGKSAYAGAISGMLLGGISGAAQAANSHNVQNMLNYARQSTNENVRSAGAALEQALMEGQESDQDDDEAMMEYAHKMAQARRNLSKQIAAEKKTDRKTHDTIIEAVHEQNAEGRKMAKEYRETQKAIARDKKAITKDLVSKSTSEVLEAARDEFAEKGSLSAETLTKVRIDSAALAALGVDANQSKVKMNAAIISGLKSQQNAETKTSATNAAAETTSEGAPATAEEAETRTYSPAVIDVVKSYESTESGKAGGTVTNKVIEKVAGNATLREFFGIDDNLLVGATAAQRRSIVRDAIISTISSQGLESANMTGNPSTVREQKKSRTYLEDRVSEIERTTGLSLEAFTEAYRKTNPDATDSEIETLYNNYLEKLALSNEYAYTKVGDEIHKLSFEQFADIMTEYGRKKGLSFTEQQLRQMFTNAVNTSQDVRAEHDAANFEKQKAKMDKLVDVLNEHLKAFGTDVTISYDEADFASNENAFIRLFRAKGEFHIVINGNRVTSVGAVRKVIGHELFHPAESIKSKDNTAFVENAVSTFKALNRQGKLEGYVLGENTLFYNPWTGNGESMSELLDNYDDTLDRYIEAYKDSDPDFDRDNAAQEFMADCMNAVFGKNNTRLVRDITNYTPSFTERAYDVCLDIRALFGNTAAQQHKAVVKELNRLCEDMRTALVESAKGSVSEDTKVDLENDATATQRASITSLAKAANLEIQYDKESGFISFTADGKPVDRVTPKLIKETSLGALITTSAERGYLGKTKAENKAAAKAQYQLLADTLNMIQDTQLPDMIWAFEGSALFSAIRTNADPQYSTTVDFTTVCVKTQDMITAMSADMKRLGRGLTKAEVTELQARVFGEGLSVPCPVCYVFSRWAGIGSTLNNMYKWQEEYKDCTDEEIVALAKLLKINENASDKLKAPFKELTELTEEEKERYRDLLRENGHLPAALERDSKLTDAEIKDLLKADSDGDYAYLLEKVERYTDQQSRLEKRRKAQRDTRIAEIKQKAAERIAETKSKEEQSAIRAERDAEIERVKAETAAAIKKDAEVYKPYITAYKDQLSEMEKDGTAILSWLSNTRLRDDYKYTPAEILFDLDMGAELAKNYPATWRYRTSRGSGAGKAIVPYSDMRTGDMIVGPKNNVGSTLFSKVENGEFNEAQKKAFDSAIGRVAAQNLIGGYRFQSTSDFRYDYALDYLQVLLEAQALGSNIQTYTKVAEYAEIIAAVGGDANLSVMPLNSGVDGDGHLIFSSITGVDYNVAKELAQKYNNLQLILVGINDEHIKKAITDVDENGVADGWYVGFVIPYHASGASINNFISALVENLGETFNLDYYKSYEKMQNDLEFSDDVMPEVRDQLAKMGINTKANADLRQSILTGKFFDRMKKLDPGQMSEYLSVLKDKKGNYLKSVDITKRSFDDLLEVERKALSGDEKAMKEYLSWSRGVLAELYQRYESGNPKYTYSTLDGTQGRVKLTSDQAGHVMPHEYWNKKTTRGRTLETNNAYVNGFIFRSYCTSLGLCPRFTGYTADGQAGFGDFSGRTVAEGESNAFGRGYWKTLIDRAMYNSSDTGDGRYREQQNVNINKMNSEMLKRDSEYGRQFEGRRGYSTTDPNAQRATEVGIAHAEEILARGEKKSSLTYQEATDLAKATVEEINNLSDTRVGDAYDRIVSTVRGKNKMVMFANITNPFEMELTTDEANSIYDRYFAKFHKNDTYGTYRAHVIDKLQSTVRVFDYLKEAAEKNNTTTSEILFELGYDGVHDGPEWVAFNSSQLKNVDNLTPSENDDIRYSLSSNPNAKVGININNSVENIVQRLQSGGKTVETRDTPSLRKYVGQVVGIVSTEDKRYGGRATVVGYAKILKEIRYPDQEAFDKDFTRHGISENSKYAFSKSKTGEKYGYVLEWVKDEPKPYTVTEFGITARDIDPEAQTASDFPGKFGSAEEVATRDRRQSTLQYYIKELKWDNLWNEEFIHMDDAEAKKFLNGLYHKGKLSSAGYSILDQWRKDYQDARSSSKFSMKKADASYAKAAKKYMSDSYDYAALSRAEELVRDAALAWGAISDYRYDGQKASVIPLELVHGTKFFGFTKFNTTSGAIYLTNSSFTASTYSGTDGIRGIKETDYWDRGSRGNYGLYVRDGNILQVDCQGMNWNRIPFSFGDESDIEEVSTRDIEKWAKKKGYDGVHFTNVVDLATSVADEDAYNARADVWAIFDAKNVKSSDAFTYDNNGDVIPLSKRFSDDEDIRYSRTAQDGSVGKLDYSNPDDRTTIAKKVVAALAKGYTGKDTLFAAPIETSEAKDNALILILANTVKDMKKTQEGRDVLHWFKRRYRTNMTAAIDALKLVKDLCEQENTDVPTDIISREGVFDNLGIGKWETNKFIEFLAGYDAYKSSAETFNTIRDLLYSQQENSPGLIYYNGHYVGLADENYVMTSLIYPEKKYSSKYSRTAEAIDTETDEFAAFDSYDDFDARKRGFASAREATNALIDERIAKYGRIGETGKNNARETKVPTKMKAKTNVSKSVETIMASGITPDFRIDDINDAIVGGKADYVSVKNKTLENRAKAKVRNIGFQKAAQQFIEASKQGKVNDDLVALGAVLLNNAGNSNECSGSEYIDILQAYVNISHRSAVALQAQNILKKLTPSGKLYAMQQEINKLNEERQKNGFDYGAINITPGQKAKHDAAVETDNKHVEWWMEDTGKILSKDLLGHVKTIMQDLDGTLGADVSEAKVQTVCQTVLDDLRLFAKEKMPEINRSMKHRSVMDRLRDLAANSEQYEEAWEQARQYLSLKLDLSDEDAAAAVSYVMDDALKVSDRLMEQISDKEGIKIDEDLARAFLMAETEKEQDAIMDEIAQKVADQIPVKFRDKLTAWRYLAMLGNFKTQIRNVVGNAGFKRVRQVKDIIAGALESQFAKDDRTTSAFRDTATLRDADAQKACAEDMKYIMAGGTKYEYRSETEQYRSEFGQKIKDKQRIFNNGILEFWRTRTDKAMSEGFTVNIAGKDRTFFGDEKFCRFTYMDSLARSMRAYGTTWANATEDQRNNARDRAILEAARATYRDNNQFAQAVSAIRFRNPDTTAKKFVNMLSEGILPFRKTPANIPVRAIEYSPINALNGMTEAVLLKLGKNVDAEGNTKFTRSDVINTFAESITGTGIMAIGWALAAGLVPGLKLHGKSDDDDPLDAFNKMQGVQQYSIEFNGHTYTLDWLAPESIPLFLGANLAQASLEGGLSLQEAIDALMSITDPMLEMSMLQGINDALKNAADFASDAALPNFISNALWSMVSQFMPTILGQAERAVDNTRRSTYVNPNSAVPSSWQKALGKLSAKTPLWDYDQIAYTDAWGREQKLQDTALGNALYQFLSPWYSTTVKESDMERELERLYEVTAEPKILMTTASKKISGVLEHPEDEKSGSYEKQLTAAEYTTYNVTRGQTAYNAITAFTESEDYNNLTDKQKVDVIMSLINFADTTGKIAATPYTYTNEKGEVVVTSAYPESKAYKKAREAMEAGMPLYQYYTASAVGADCEYLVDSNGENIANSKDLYQMQAIYKAFPNASKEEYAQMFEAASISTSIRGYNANMVNSKITAMERYGSLSVLGATGIDAVDSELNRLTASDITTNVLMGSTSKKFKVSSNPNSKTATNDTEIELTDEQYEQYDTYRRETGSQLLNTLITSSQYRGLTDEQKAKAISAMESYINASGKKMVASSYVTDSTVDKVAAAKKQGISEATYFSVWSVKNGTDAKLYKTDGSVVTNSAGLYQMQAIYRSVPGLSQAQYTAMFEYIGIPKGVRGLTSSEVNAKLSKLVDKYGMNKG